MSWRGPEADGASYLGNGGRGGLELGTRSLHPGSNPEMVIHTLVSHTIHSHQVSPLPGIRTRQVTCWEKPQNEAVGECMVWEHG